MNTTVASVLVLAGLVSTVHAEEPEVPQRTPLAGEIVVCFRSAADGVDLDAVTAGWQLGNVHADFAVDASRAILRWQRPRQAHVTNIVLVRFPGHIESGPLLAHLEGQDGIEWCAPNYLYTGEVRELEPNDPQYGSQYHHPLMQNDLAWDLSFGDPSIIVAVTDDGVDLDHEDLVAGIWVNPGEIPGNGIDDEGNGYIDDVNGWDFIHDNNNPNPDGGDDHGTHCAGIAAAGTNNGVGVAGTGGGATIMPIQWYDGGGWTSEIIANSFAYAVDNGASIVSTSYNIDGWVGDPTVIAGFQYLYDQGGMHFNSAGNGNTLNPPRQVFHQTFLVANTDSGDVRNGSSNYGTGIDLAAPGTSILSTILNDGYGTKTGTSMAAPNAAGVAALIWSANPTWTRDQVAAQIYATADNIDAQNPSIAGLLGGGRVNSFRALTETLPAPKVTTANGLPEEGETALEVSGAVTMRFDQVMSPAAVNDPGAFALIGAGPDGRFGTADDTTGTMTWNEYMVGANEVVFDVDMLPQGTYRFVADASVVANPFGTGLDGNGDGVGGDSWTRTFGVCAGTIVLEDTLEIGLGWTVENIAVADGAWDELPSVPIGGGDRGDPPTDYDTSGKCFLTDNVDGNSDVDGGPTMLISPPLDLTGIDDPALSYARWFTGSSGDTMVVDVSSNDGVSWTEVEVVTGNPGWFVHLFRVSDFVTPSAQTRLRFSATDAGSGSVVEGGIDYIRILTFDCSDPDPADIDGDGIVGIQDLLLLLAAWGPCGDPCPEDVDGDGIVGFPDLTLLLASWTTP
jgi:subtilisin family serine protease